MLLATSLKGEEVARELLVVLSTTLGVKPGNLLAAMRDRAAVNGAAMKTAKVLYPNLLDVGCFLIPLTMLVNTFRHLFLMTSSTAGHPFSHTAPRHNCCGRPAQAVSSDTRWWSK